MRVYADYLLDRIHRSLLRFVHLVQRARDTGYLYSHHSGHAGQPRQPRVVQIEEEILDSCNRTALKTSPRMNTTL
ncbi:unnamed protein product [Callosobruchus maculatus]|uniref:Uncharacterized protein n=1 Tax=Callosobruchus maculatus TaxID=64391 RepID=A0A653BT86_CALMS|nr:unnamed protein product [Callosobruchus maculatus]